MRLLQLLGLLCVLGGCRGGAPVVSLEPVTRPIDHRQYDDVRDRWTRHAQIIKKLDTTLRVYVTCFGPEFIAAYVAQRAHMFRLPAGEVSQLRDELMAEWSKSYTFLMAASTIDSDHNDFDRATSIWRVVLENDRDQQLKPRQIRAERKANATISALFPFVGRFYRVYTITFPKTLEDGRPLVSGETERITLRINGPLGHSELTWRLQ